MDEIKRNKNKIETTYHIGQKIYALHTSLERKERVEKCPNCKGNSSREQKGGTWTCGSCHSGTKFHSWEQYEIGMAHASPLIVKGIFIRIEESGVVGERVLLRELDNEKTVFNFLVGEEKTYEWDLEEQEKRDIEYRLIHLTKESALEEIERVRKLIKEMEEKDGHHC